MIREADLVSALKLDIILPSATGELPINEANICRPGLQLTGYWDFFAFERPQVIGKVEMAYLDKRTPEERRELLERFFSYRIPCVIICRGMEPPAELLEVAERKQVFLFATKQVTTKFTVSAIHYLNRCLAPHITRHGVLLDVFGVGVMLSGKSGVGKSEAALELVKRGHMLVADDVVDICKISDDRLIGSCPEKVRHLMEIRGIGVIDIRAMFGIGAVAVSKSIDLILELEVWDDKKEYDRIGLEEETVDILGVPVPCQTIPIKPGRNLAIIVEAAARNLSLKRSGHSAIQELTSMAFPEA